MVSIRSVVVGIHSIRRIVIIVHCHFVNFQTLSPNHRMAATERSEGEMRDTMNKLLSTSQDPMDKLRCQCLIRGCAGIKQFGRLFRIMDDNRDRKLNFVEFQKGICDFGAQLTKDEITALFNKFDTNNSGSIDFDEFLIALRPPMSQSRLSIIALAFHKLDKNGNGVITVDDLKNVYTVSGNSKYITGEATEEEIFAEFLKTFEMNDHVDGIVTKEEFINYYAGVSASIDSDAYFDLMMRKAWKL
ncbi:Calcyphosin-like protein [Trichinella nativa]|uniref:Calcyphosin-like protein n=1 Tax=Trichinella nativa TaxID=6335 RepID=A0A0V1LF68_9BILA|nr:Calcyphosin-like protein [Trichinella nativa]